MQTKTNEIETALWEAAFDVSDLEPIGAGFQVSTYRGGKWQVSDEMPINQARRIRSAALARRALEIMGADPVEAAHAVDALDDVGPVRNKIRKALSSIRLSIASDALPHPATFAPVAPAQMAFSF